MKHLHTRRWFRLDAHDEEGGSDGGGDGSGQGGGAAAGGDGGDAGGDGGGDTKTFTQADVDRIVQDRLGRERQKYSDYDDIKSKADQYDQLQAEQQSDLEKAQAAADTEKTAREKAEAKARRVATRAAVLEQAADKKITDAKLAARLLDTDRVEFDDDGEPTNIGELLDGLVAEHPILTATAGSAADDGGDGSGSADGGTGAGGDGAGGGGASKDFTKASDSEFAGELAKYGLRPR